MYILILLNCFGKSQLSLKNKQILFNPFQVYVLKCIHQIRAPPFLSNCQHCRTKCIDTKTFYLPPTKVCHHLFFCKKKLFSLESQTQSLIGLYLTLPRSEMIACHMSVARCRHSQSTDFMCLGCLPQNVKYEQFFNTEFFSIHYFCRQRDWKLCGKNSCLQLFINQLLKRFNLFWKWKMFHKIQWIH